MLVHCHSDTTPSNWQWNLYNTCRNNQLLIIVKQHQTSHAGLYIDIKHGYLIDHVIILPYCKAFSTQYCVPLINLIAHNICAHILNIAPTDY